MSRQSYGTDDKKMLLASFQAELLSLYQAPLRAPKTLEKMRQVFQILLRAQIVENVEDLTPPAIARFATKALEGRSPNTVRGLLSYLRAACSYAVACGYLARSPFDARRVWVRPERTARRRFHSIQEIHRLLSFLEIKGSDWEDRRLHALVATVAYTGIRRTEALHLEWADIDFDRKLVHIVAHKNRLKTTDSAAILPIPESLASILSAWRKLEPSRWVFPNSRHTGPWESGSRRSKAINQIRDAGLACGIEGVCFLSLRHSYATHAEATWGLSELQLQRLLRHTNSKTQLAYRHAEIEGLRAAVSGVSY